MLSRLINASDINAAGGALGPFAYNATPQTLAKINAALLKTRLKISATKILCTGESTTAGNGSGLPLGVTTPNRKYSYPDLLAARLSALDASLVTRTDGVFGIQGFSTSGYFASNTLITGTNWGTTTGLNSIGGAPFYNNTNTNPLVYNPGTTFDRIEIAYWKHPTSADDLTVDIGGATLATLTGAATAAYATATVNCTRGQNTVNIRRVGNSGTAGVVWRIRCYDSTAPGVEVHNAGVGSTLASFWATNSNALAVGCDPVHAVQTYAPDLTIHDDGINDAFGSTAVATYKANVQTFITAAKVTGDVILMAPNPVSAGDLTPYNAALMELALANNCVFLDLFNKWGGTTAAFGALGYNYDTYTHPNSLGYYDKADFIARVLLRSF
jgi:lysophospholipase L1-like esterase